MFKGTEINNDVIPTKQATQIVDTGFFIAERYAQAGYRGYFDVDYIAGKNGKIYVTESNVRRTGGTHVYQTAEKLFGKDFMYETYIMSHNSYPIKNTRITTFSYLKNHLKPILFNKKTREGMVIVSESGLKMRQLAYIIFGKTERRAVEIEAEMEKLLA